MSSGVQHKLAEGLAQVAELQQKVARHEFLVTELEAANAFLQEALSRAGPADMQVRAWEAQSLHTLASAH